MSLTCAMPTIMKIMRATALPIDAIAERSKSSVRIETKVVEITTPTFPLAPALFPRTGGKLPNLGEIGDDASCGEELGVDRRRGRKAGANRHDHEAGASENRRGGGNGGVTGGNDLLELEHAVHTDRNRDVENGGDDQGQIHSLGQVPARVLHVPRGKGDQGESQEGE